MSGIIYYQTKYGSTEEYARWLSEDVGFELKDIKKGPKIGPEKVVVIGSNLLMGKVTAAGWIKKNWDKIKDKQVVFFSVGGSKVGSKDREDIITRSLPKDMTERMRIFHLPGRIDHKKLNFLMSRIVKSVGKHEKDEEERRRALEGYDDVKREYLEPIVAYIKSL
jgi:menaquinone-dependent protoporphyrinogen IX oxidase